MRRHRSLLILLLLLPLLTILALARPAAAQSDDTLVITVEPLIVAPGGSVTVEVKNFRWSGVARLDVVLRPDAPAEPILLSEGLRLGSRRRAGLSATPPTPGDWEAVADGQWIFGEAIHVETRVLVATTGSTVGTLALGQSVSGEIVPDPAWEGGAGMSGWGFELTEPQAVTVQARAQNGEAISELAIQGNGIEHYEDDTGLIANLELEAGRYVILVIDDTATAYTLSLSSGLSGDTEGGPLAPGTVLPGLLSPPSDVDEFTFSAAPGDVVYAAMSATEPALDPYLELLDPVGNRVALNDDGRGFDAVLAYVVPTAGQYVLRLTSNQGGSAGAYALELAFDPEMTRQTPPTLIAVGDVAQGLVERGGAQAWRVAGDAGDRLGVRVESRTSGFDARLTIYGPDGQQIAFDDDSGGNLNPLLNLTLPDDGYYTLVVSSYTGEAGQYSLSAAAQPFPTPTP